MCTVSWLIEPGGFSLFFNRDELKTRAAALPPRIDSVEGVSYLSPLDPQGGGTWIGANQLGFACCLLNEYGAERALKIRVADPLSRGLIVKELLASDSRDAALGRLHNMDLGRCRPFSVLLFDPGSDPALFNWNGLDRCVTQRIQPPYSSSGFDTSTVLQVRREIYPSVPSQHSLEQFHAYHAPKGGAYSVCMHRSDAETVSFTRISVRREEIEMDYLPASPCRRDAVELQHFRMPR